MSKQKDAEAREIHRQAVQREKREAGAHAAPAREQRLEQREWHLAGVIFFALLALVVLAVALRLLWPFASALVLAVVIVVLSWPLYVRLRTRLGDRSATAATLMLLGIVVCLVLPVTLIGVLLVNEANTLIKSLQDPQTQAMLSSLDLSSRLAFVKRWAPSFDPAALSPQRLLMPLLQEVPGFVARHGADVVGSVAGIVVTFFLMLLASWYFYVEGEAILDTLADLSPLPRRYDRQFGERVKTMIEATFRGQVFSALAHGIACVAGLLIAGVPGALLWGSLASVMSLVPMVGAAIVWLPAAGYLAISASMGHRGWWAPIFMLIWGVVVVSQVDNVVRPWAMKGRSEMPAIPVLFAVLGGLEAFGFIGLVIGPLVFSLVKSVIDIYMEAFADVPSGDAGDAAKGGRL